MGFHAKGHDRTTGAPGRDPGVGSGRAGTPPAAAPTTLDTALQGLRLDGALFFRAEFTEGWAYRSPAPEQLVRILRPGAGRLIVFHIVSGGTCWARAREGEPRWAREGDVVVVPYGERHAMGGAETAEEVPILDLLDPPPWRTLPVLRHGAGGGRTDIVCGYLHSDHPLFDPALQALPPLFVVRPPEGPAATWIRSSIDYALASGSPAPATDRTATRLPELVLLETLRLHLATAPAIDTGWLAALADPVLAPVLARMHAAPDRHWTVQRLADTAAVSRSALDERFRRILGRSPIRYLADWRMHLAEDLLATTGHSVGAVARRVGYDSEEAFSRAFKRTHAVAPGAWRRAAASGPPTPGLRRLERRSEAGLP
ncbi:AraC family transcriptional regulator [Streptomyces sp. NPDC005811]|uniref:AraC family transcriptional regulator n=1 Tax=Streptomyces sp. NPDC005811 TaxID=3154565 RepID=UPI0034014744